MKPIKVVIMEPLFIPTNRSSDTEPAICQVFPILLSGFSPVTRKHFVVCASFPHLDESQRDSVASQLCLGGAGASCDFIVHDTEGAATVVADLGEAEASDSEAAAAVAVVKASCGWDESKPIFVRVNDKALYVFASFDGGEWVARVSTSG